MDHANRIVLFIVFTSSMEASGKRQRDEDTADEHDRLVKRQGTEKMQAFVQQDIADLVASTGRTDRDSCSAAGDWRDEDSEAN